ncbi:SET [Seminavis robusta]|uniref:SET n=1 Tax=Seminavis robusta TaxID=568900 RepID=A0A9N8H721_9STRA|nr:SET [Seminavis robusta]|eukprot:Sro58_g033720.1 SET (361) ;mRNA; r:60974-62056
MDAPVESSAGSPPWTDAAEIPEPPDIPSCDACGKAFSGRLVCGHCHLTWYCSKACQKIAWKQQGHKTKCKTMKETCQDTALAVVTEMANTAAPPILRVQKLDGLDLEGPFRIALEQHNLHQVIYDMLLEDRQSVQKRFLQGNNINNSFQHASFVQWIMTTLFRGGRISPRAVQSSNTRYADACRVKAFVLFKEDALEVWWDASMKFVVQVVMDKKLFQRHKELHAGIHFMARDILASWSQILTCPKAAKAILYHNDGTKAVARATYLATSTKRTLQSLHTPRDPRAVLEAYLNQNLAMIDYWCHLWKIPVNVEQLAGFKDDVAQKMYQNMAKPLAQGTIRKGFALNNQETQSAMAQPVDW